MKLTCFLVTLCGAICFLRNTDGARILAIFPSNIHREFLAFQEILTALAERGHLVDVVSHFPLEKPPPNYINSVNLVGRNMAEAENLTIETLEDIDNIGVQYWAANFGNKLCNLLDTPGLAMLIKNPPKDPPYDLVITELFYANCYLAFGRHLKVPVVAVTSSSMPQYVNEPLGNPLNTAFVSEHKDGSIFSMNFWQRLKNTISTSWECFKIRRTTKAQSEIVRKYFGPKISDVRELERDLSLLLVNSHHTLDGIRPNTPAVVEVGGLHLRDDKTQLSTDMQRRLDETNGFIYVSFDPLLRVESFPNETLTELFASFSRIAPIQVLLQTADPKQLPPGRPKNLILLKWIPHHQVLKHGKIRGFVTHGSSIDVQRAVRFGVPIIAFPISTDQQRNVKNLVDRGVALSLDYKDLTADEFVDTVNAIVEDPKYKNNMASLSKQFLDRPLSARDTAVFWIEYILKYGGDSLRSPAVNLSWWQLSLLDIYGSVIAASLLMLYIFKIIIFRIIHRLLDKECVLPTTKKIV